MNVVGWTLANSRLRKAILKTQNADIISVNETHLKPDEVITLEGYIWYGFNRQIVHIQAPKGSGGVGIFVKQVIFSLPVGSLCHTRGVVRRPASVVRRPSFVVRRVSSVSTITTRNN